MQRDELLRKREQALGDLGEFRLRVRAEGCHRSHAKVRCTVIDLLRKQVAAERQDARTRLMNESVRLGQVVYERYLLEKSFPTRSLSVIRHGTNFIESWQDGMAFKQLAQRKVCCFIVSLIAQSCQLKNQELQAEVERLKKNAKKKGAKPAEVGESEDLAARLLVLKRVCAHARRSHFPHLRSIGKRRMRGRGAATSCAEGPAHSGAEASNGRRQVTIQ